MLHCYFPIYGIAILAFLSSSQGTDTDVSAATQVQKSFLDAVKRGQLENVKLYHQQGAKLMAPDSNGWTPLHHAARLGRLEIVKYIADNSESKSNVEISKCADN